MRAAFISEAGLDGMTWLHSRDRVESIVTYALAKAIHRGRAEAQKKAEGH